MKGDQPLRPHSLVGAYTCLSIMVVSWGLSFVATKVALESFPPFTLVFGRLFLSSAFFLLLISKTGFPRFTLKDHAKVFLTALFEPGLYFVFETIGLQYTTAPKAALIIATVPIVVLIFASLFLRERTALSSLVGIGISIAGIFVLITGDSDFQWILSGHLLGDALILGAVISAAFYTVCARDLGKRKSAFQITSLQIFYGALMYAPAFLWEAPDVEWSGISMRSVTALLYLTLFASIAAFLCYNYALTRIPASRAAVFINGIPLVTALGAWFFLGETLTLLQLGGGCLVLAGVLLTNVFGTRVKTGKKELPETPATLQGQVL